MYLIILVFVVNTLNIPIPSQTAIEPPQAIYTPHFHVVQRPN